MITINIHKGTLIAFAIGMVVGFIAKAKIKTNEPTKEDANNDAFTTSSI